MYGNKVFCKFYCLASNVCHELHPYVLSLDSPRDFVKTGISLRTRQSRALQNMLQLPKKNLRPWE
jgi:hypothetical protein